MKGSTLLALISVLALAGCGGGPVGDPENGEALFNQETIGQAAPGCITCHSLQPGETKVGPALTGVASQAEQRITSADYMGEADSAEGYLRESILQPDAHVVDGFQPVIMYPEFGEELTEQQLNDLVAFLLTLE